MRKKRKSENLPEPGVTRVAFVMLAKTLGGAERRYVRLARALAEDGVYVSLFANLETLELLRHNRISLGEIKVNMVRAKAWQNSGTSLANVGRRVSAVLGWLVLAAALRQGRLTHVHLVANHGFFVLMMTLLSFRLPPMSFSIFGMETSKSGKRGWAEITAISVACLGANKVDCLMPGYQDFAKRYTFARRRDRIRLAPGSFSNYADTQIAKKRDIEVVFLARFAEGKGLSLLPGVKARLAELGVTLHAVGAGPLRHQIGGPNVYETVNSYEILGRSKIFLSIQEFENYPSQSLLEAMASECSIIATDVGWTRLLLDESVAELVNPRVEDIVKSVIFLLNNPALASQRGKAGRQRVIEDHTIERYVSYFKKEILS
jgi:glycosyltransferase involved in cell wall biosynthesis